MRGSSTVDIFQVTALRKREQEAWVDLQENHRNGRPWEPRWGRTKEKTASWQAERKRSDIHWCQGSEISRQAKEEFLWGSSQHLWKETGGWEKVLHPGRL